MAKSKGVDADLVSFSKDWHRLQAQKFRHHGGVEARMLTALSMHMGEQGTVQTRDAFQLRAGQGSNASANQLHLVFNLLKKAAKRRMGRLWKVAPEFKASPTKIDAVAFDNADIMNDMILALDYRCKEKALHWKRLWWTVLCGVCVEHIPWIEEEVEEPVPAYDPDSGELLWTNNADGTTVPQSVALNFINQGAPPEQFTVVEHLQTVGDVGAQILSPFNIFIDASVTEIKYLGPDQAMYIGEVRTVDWIAETFGSEYADKVTSKPGDDLSIVRTKLLDKGVPLASMNLKDMIPAIQGSRSNDDPPLAIVLTRYQPANKKYPHGRRTIFVPDQCTVDDGETKYGEIPCVDLHYEAPTVSFWTQDFITDLIAPQKYYNKRWSQMGEHSNSSVHETLLLGGEIGPRDVPTDMPGFVKNGLSEEGRPLVQALQRTPLPGWFLESLRGIADFIDNVGGSDLTQTKQFPGQIRGPLAMPMIQELLDSEDGPFFSHMGEQLASIKQQRINRVKLFYPPIRTLHYTGRNNKDEVMVFHKENLFKAGTDYKIRVDQASLFPEMAVMRRARVLEDLAGPGAILYTNRRTGKLDASKIAIAMKYTDSDIEDRATQYRKLAGHLIQRMREGQALPPTYPYPFWDHDAIMDELEGAMATTEFLEASPQVQQNFQDFYERCRQYLSQIQQSQMDSTQNQMMQGAVAQATQVAAAKAASIATDTAVGQIQAQASQTMAMSPEQRQAASPGQPPLAPGPSMPQ